MTLGHPLAGLDCDVVISKNLMSDIYLLTRSIFGGLIEGIAKIFGKAQAELAVYQ